MGAVLTEASGLGRAARARLAGQHLVAPELLDLEAVSVFRKLVRAGKISERTAATAVQELATFPVHRWPHARLLERCWSLKDNVTPYDASYIALAELLAVPLVTTDARLARAPGLRCAIEVLA
jgi:predicted nucleic acid-binding protein